MEQTLRNIVAHLNAARKALVGAAMPIVVELVENLTAEITTGWQIAVTAALTGGAVWWVANK